MSATTPRTRPRHVALAGCGGRTLDDHRLTDRERLAILLQGAALLSHLQLAGWRLDGGWMPARVDEAGGLRELRAVPGAGAELPQALLTDLTGQLFGDLPPAGRGQARQVARGLLRRWCFGLVAIPPDLAVGQLLEAAPFLWQARFAAARAALAGELGSGRRRSLWVAGPGRFRRRLLAGCEDLEGLETRLRSSAARRAWEPGPRAAGERASAAVRVERSRELCRQGRHRTALTLLARLRRPGARVARLEALAGLGRLTAARRLLGSLEDHRFEADVGLDLAEIAVRVLANAGEADRASIWVRRALDQAPAAERARAELLAAAAAWDRGDLAAMQRWLRLARSARDDPRLGWRWRQLRGLGAYARGDGVELVEQVWIALAEHRRGLTQPEAAGLWNELGIGRALTDDLAGAERALRHAVRLLNGSDGPQRTDLALLNLAELRLRRGRLGGIRELIERSASRNRRLGNWRAWAHDQELHVRLELARGRLHDALSRAERALDRLRRRRVEWRRAELHAQAARALGWLGRRRQAREHLRRASGRAAQALFEPEERPALWLLAADRRRAWREVGAHPLAALWRPVLEGEGVAPGAWRRLECLGSYRSARWVYDVEKALPGALPLDRIRVAAARLRRLGADSLADELAARETGAWTSFGAYLRAPDPGVPDLGQLLRSAGASEARLVWRRGGQQRVLIGGVGGDVRLTTPCGRGRLELSVEAEDGPLRTILDLAARDLESELEGESPPPVTAGPRIVGASAVLAAALDRVDRLAPREVPIVVVGETGTGKELVARRIHSHSARGRRPLLAVNCAALPESLLLAELFGHRRGAFTGADRDRAGIFESAEGGTVFLDEVGDLPLEAQGSLLRVLQEGEVRRVGENRPRRVNVRIVAATHRDLPAMVDRGRFREDLYYRLGGAAIRLPPLRERGHDVLMLSRYFLAELAPRRRMRLAKGVRHALLDYSWPGNVRELRNKLRVATALAEEVIRLPHLDLPDAPDGEGLYHQRIEQVRVQLVRDALAAAEGNQAAAARRLGITRQAFSYLVRKFELS